MKNRWELTDETKTELKPVIERFLANSGHEEIDLSDTSLNPFTLEKFLEEYGYEKMEYDTNGWQLDFWIKMQHGDELDNYVQISGCGITFELKLSHCSNQ